MIHVPMAEAQPSLFNPGSVEERLFHRVRLENRLFTDADDYSMEIELPLADCPRNLGIFGHLTRKDINGMMEDSGTVGIRCAHPSAPRRGRNKFNERHWRVCCFILLSVPLNKVDGEPCVFESAVPVT